MNKAFISILSLILLFLNSCKYKMEVIKDNNLAIKDFSMTHYAKTGERLYQIVSPLSTFNNKTQVYELEQTLIKFFEKDKNKYIVNSNKATLLNNNQFLKLNGDVLIIDNSDDKSLIKAEVFYWDINKSEFILEGNVNLINNYINLISSKASLNKKNNIIKFYKPVQYNYKNINTKYKISADNAYYDLNNNSVTFKSGEDRVKSSITF